MDANFRRTVAFSYGIETVQSIPFGLGKTPRDASAGNRHADSRAMTFPAAERRITLLRAAADDPPLAASVTLRPLLKIATLCAPEPGLSPPASPMESTLGMTILKSTCAVAATFPLSPSARTLDSAAA